MAFQATSCAVAVPQRSLARSCCRAAWVRIWGAPAERHPRHCCWPSDRPGQRHWEQQDFSAQLGLSCQDRRCNSTGTWQTWAELFKHTLLEHFSADPFGPARGRGSHRPQPWLCWVDRAGLCLRSPPGPSPPGGRGAMRERGLGGSPSFPGSRGSPGFPAACPGKGLRSRSEPGRDAVERWPLTCSIQELRWFRFPGRKGKTGCPQVSLPFS